MKNLTKVGVALFGLATLMTSALAAGPLTGIWHGRVSFDTTKLPNPTDPNQKKLMMTQLKTQEALKITLTLKGDNTFSLVAIGAGTPKPVSGTYKAVGTTVTITPTPKSGQPSRSQTFNLSKDSKSMSFTQGPVTLNFTR